MAEKNEAALMTVAALASHVKEHQPGMTFAQQMGMPKSEGGKARVSGLRFRRLLQHRNHEELFSGVTRTIHLLGGTVNLHSLADGAYWWNDNTKKAWAFDYYETAPDEK
jgi:CRISPR system Cascade subunit CasB